MNKAQFLILIYFFHISLSYSQTITGIITDNENNVASSSKNTINIIKTDFTNVSQMNIKAAFTTSSISEAVNIYSYYNLKLNLSARLKQIYGD